MKNRDAALELGEEINRLRNQIVALEGLMMEFRVTGDDGRYREPQWRQTLPRVANEPSHQELVHARSDELKAAIPESTSESDLIQALHGHFLKS